jgi:hypothetical protein
MLSQARKNQASYGEAIEETGELDSNKIRTEIVESAKEFVRGHQGIRSILLECSIMPPYSAAIQAATNLPVYDFVTMIKHTSSAIKAKQFADTCKGNSLNG